MRMMKCFWPLLVVFGFMMGAVAQNDFIGVALGVLGCIFCIIVGFISYTCEPIYIKKTKR